jgi:hypothetical protein
MVTGGRRTRETTVAVPSSSHAEPAFPDQILAVTVNPSSWLATSAPGPFAQEVDGIIPNQPEDGGALVVFLIVGAALGGVYWLIRRSRRKSEDAYWDRKRREEERRRNDPDMARPGDPGAADEVDGSDEG